MNLICYWLAQLIIYASDIFQNKARKAGFNSTTSRQIMNFDLFWYTHSACVSSSINSATKESNISKKGDTVLLGWHIVCTPCCPKPAAGLLQRAQKNHHIKMLTFITSLASQFRVEYIHQLNTCGLRYPSPRMGGFKGETGASPVLSRNCKSAIMLTSQVARLSPFTTASRKGGVNSVQTIGNLTTPPLSHDRGFCLTICHKKRQTHTNKFCAIVSHLQEQAMLTKRKLWFIGSTTIFGIFLALSFLFLFPRQSPAQEPDKANIVVQFDENRSVVREIKFTAPITGFAALMRTGLDVEYQDFGWGIAVCSIEGVGCPAEDCFCDPSGKYWGYFYWDGGNWQSHSAGATDHQLNAGDTDGWYWGAWGETLTHISPTLAAKGALAWIQTQQVITDGGFGGDSVTMDALIATASNHIDPRTWAAAPGAPSLRDYFLIKGADIADDDAGNAGKLAVGLAASGLCYPYGAPTPMDYYDPGTGLYDPLPPNHAMAIVGTAALSQTIPVEAVQALIDMQNLDGGWSWASGFGSDSNSTAIAIQALVAAGQSVTSTEVVSGLLYLKSAQNEDGGFTYDPKSIWGTASDVNSTAYAINAIYAAGQDPMTGTWVISNTNPISYLLSVQMDNGAFPWQPGYGENLLATVQAVPALLGYHLPIKQFQLPECPAPAYLPLVIQEP